MAPQAKKIGDTALDGAGFWCQFFCFPREGQKDPPASYFTRPPGGSNPPGGRVNLAGGSGPSRQLLDPPARSVDPPARSGDPPARSVDPPARSGDPPARSGDPPARSGDPPARSVDPPASFLDPPARFFGFFSLYVASVRVFLTLPRETKRPTTPLATP